MKKSLTITVLLLAVFLLAASTAGAKLKFTTGPKFGINILSFAGKDADLKEFYPDADLGYIAGGFIGWVISAELNEYLTIQIEPGYTQRGADWEQDYTIADTTGTESQYVRLNYFKIPLIAKLTLPEKKIRPFLCAGMDIAFNSSSSSQIEDIAYANDNKVRHNSIYFDEIYNPKGTIFDVIFGIGLETTWRAKKISLEGRYIFNFGTVFDDVENPNAVASRDIAFIEDSGAGLEIRHSLFSILIGVSFPL